MHPGACANLGARHRNRQLHSRLDGALQCYSFDELCDGNVLCDIGFDERHEHRGTTMRYIVVELLQSVLVKLHTAMFTSIISPPNRTSGSNFRTSIPQLSTSFFLRVISIFPHGRCTYAAPCLPQHCFQHLFLLRLTVPSVLHDQVSETLHTLERTWASQLRQSLLTQTSTARGDPSELAAPMLTARFSYTRGYGYKLALYIVRATQAHSPARGIAPVRP